MGWSKATAEQEAKITLRHLITMSSGLDDRLRFVTAPGTKWKYNTSAYARSLTSIAKAADKTPNQLTRGWLTGVIGMRDSKWIRRPGATANPLANQIGFTTTARDLARFGLLVLANGKWNGKVVLGDRRYLKASLSPSQKMNPSYGYLWWLNGQKAMVRGARRVKGPLLPQAPDDLRGAFGAFGRKCYVVPSMQLVVTRLGDAPERAGQPQFQREFWRLLMQAAPRQENKRE